MDCQEYITESAERKKGQHLQREERGAIQHLKRQGFSNRAVARAIGCSPSTVANELRRLVRATRAENPVTRRNEEKLSTDQTDSVPGDITVFADALASFGG